MLAETDLEPRRGSILVRNGKGGKRREGGMDEWAWEHVERWRQVRRELPVGPLLCVIDGATRGPAWSQTGARAELRRLSAAAGVRRRFAPHQLRHAHAVEMAREGVPFAGRPAPARTRSPRRHQHLTSGDRHDRDHQHHSRTARADDPSQRRTKALTSYTAAGGAHRSAWRTSISAAVERWTRTATRERIGWCCIAVAPGGVLRER